MTEQSLNEIGPKELRETFRQWQALIGPAGAAELFDTITRDLERDFTELANSLTSWDYNAQAFFAHRAKGTLATTGCKHLSTVMGAIERCAREEMRPQPEALDQVKLIHAWAREALQQVTA